MSVLRLIFLGLIAFVPVDEDKMALLLEERGHKAYMVQIEGRCEEDGCVYGAGADAVARYVSEVLCEDQEEACSLLAWNLDGLEVNVAGDEANPLIVAGGRAVVDGEPADRPYRQEAIADFSWVPSVDRLVWGPARARSSCRSKRRKSSCELASRFLIEGGELSACHLLHDPGDAAKESDCTFDAAKDGTAEALPLFDFRRYQQVVGNAVSHEIAAEWPAKIEGHDFDGTRRVSAELSSIDDGDVTLIVLNEPFDECGSDD